MPSKYLASVTGFPLDRGVWKMIAVFALLFVLFYKLGAWGVLDTSEARYAEISRVMYESGDLMHPQYLGLEHYHKPPFTYWITAISHTLFGPSAFSARFFLQVAFIFQLILIFKMAHLFWESREKAWISTLSYGSMLIVLISIRNLTTDAYLTTWIMATLWAVFFYAKRKSLPHLYLAGLFAGVAFLTKITAALFFIGPMSLLIIWYYRETWRWTLHIIGALILFLAVSMSWFIALEMEGREVIRYVFYEQSVVRYSSDTYHRSMPFYFYLLVAPLLCFPWLPMVTESTVRWLRNGTNKPQILWILISVFFPILFFSISRSKLLLYILPLFWNVALFIPMVFDTVSNAGIRRWYKAQLIFFSLILLALLITPLVTDDVKGSIGMYFWWVLATGLLIWIATMNTAQSRTRILSTGIVFASMVILMAPHYLRANELNASTAKPIADWLKEEDMEDRRVLVYDRLAPSLSFHMNRVHGMISRNVTRELQWENDDQWRQFYFPLENHEATPWLNEYLDENNVILVVRNKQVPDVPQSIKDRYNNQITIGIWSVFY